MHENIHQAINAVMSEVGYVKKTKSGGLNYSFAGESALIAALRPAMVEHGIYMHVLKIENVTRESYTTAKGTAMVNTVITATIRFSHVSGTYIDVSSTGEGSDAGDKSANKAMTVLYKYAMRQTFCIETGDDPDKFASEERKPKSDITEKLWAHFQAVTEKAVKMGVPNVRAFEREKTNKDEVTAYGLELSESIKQIEAQNKAGQ